MNTLLALRIYGPATPSELARKMERHRHRVRLALMALVAAGFAECRGVNYDITPFGRDVLGAQLALKRRRRQAAAAATGQADPEADRWEC